MDERERPAGMERYVKKSLGSEKEETAFACGEYKHMPGGIQKQRKSQKGAGV